MNFNNAGVVVELEDSLIAFNRRVLPHFIELRTDIDVNRSVSVDEFWDDANDEYGDFYILAKWFFIPFATRENQMNHPEYTLEHVTTWLQVLISSLNMLMSSGRIIRVPSEDELIQWLWYDLVGG